VPETRGKGKRKGLDYIVKTAAREKFSLGAAYSKGSK
jgi:hypothetical protein